MFEIGYGEDGEVQCSGRLDAAQCAKAQSFMDEIVDARTSISRDWNTSRAPVWVYC